MLINVITLCPFHSMFQIKTLDCRTCTLLVSPAYRAITSWTHFSHSSPRQTHLKQPIPGELASAWLGSTQRTWQKWGKEEMGSPGKLQQRGIRAGVSSSFFQWRDPGTVLTSQRAALSCAAESVLCIKACSIYSPFNVTTVLVNLTADIMPCQVSLPDTGPASLVYSLSSSETFSDNFLLGDRQFKMRVLGGRNCWLV